MSTSILPTTTTTSNGRSAHPALRRPIVCHVVHSLNIGGAEMLAAGIAGRLASRFQSIFACLDEGGALAEELRNAGMSVYHLRRNGGIDLACARRLRTWLRQQQVDLIHAHQTTPLVYSLLSGALTVRPPILFTEHGRFYPDRPGWKRRFIINNLLGPRDRIVAVGSAVRDALVRVEQLPEQRIRVIYNGIETSHLENHLAVGREVRTQWGVSEDTQVVILVARFDPIKNHLLALDAITRLVRSCPRVQLWLVGDGSERGRIEAAVAAAGLSAHVRLLGEQRNVPTLLAAADIVLLTSHSEGIPLILIEGMAAGLPLVSTDVGGVRELVQHDRQGWLVQAGDGAALAECLRQLLQSPDERRRLGAAGKERAAHFTAQRMVDEYAELYDEMLTKP